MSFLAAGLLFAGITLLIPLWVHMRRAAPVDAKPVASLLLLRQTEMPVRARQKLQDRLLLLLRLLLLTALILAFAQPVVKAFVATAADSDSVPALVVVDVSASMAPHMQAARAQARSLLQGGATLVGAAAELTVHSSADDTPDAQLAALSSLQATGATLEFARLPARLSALADALSPAGTRMPIHLISDFQASGVPRRFNTLVDDLKHPLTLHPVGKLDAPNWWIEAVSRDQLTIRGANTETAEVTVSVEADGELLYRGRHVVPAAGETVVTLPASTAAAKTTRLLARLDPPGVDALPSDNVRYHVSRTGGARQIGVSGNRLQQRYVDTALRSSGVGSVVSGMNGDLLVVTGPDQNLIELADYVRSGGAALVFAGRRSGRALVDDIPGIDVVDALVAPERARLSVDDTAHPLTLALAGGQGITVFDYLPVSVSAGTVLVSLDGGDPWLIDLRWGAGRLLLVTSDLDPGNGNFAASPQFVGFLSVAVATLADELSVTAVDVGSVLRLPQSSSQVIDGNGRRLLTLAESQGRAALSVTQPGFYQLLRPQRSGNSAGSPVSSRREDFAANVPRAESDLTRLSDADLQRWQDAVNQPADGSQTFTEAQSGSSSDLPLARMLLVLVVLLLLAEALRANGLPASARSRSVSHG